MPTGLLATLTSLFAAGVGRSEFGLSESFFEAGGESLAAAEILSRIDDQLGVELRYRDFLEARTPARLALTILVERARQRGSDVADEIAALSSHDAAVLLGELEKPVP